MNDVLRLLLKGVAELEAGLGERGMVHGRRTSTPASCRAPVDLDVLVLTDRRTGVLARLLKWSQRVEPAPPPGRWQAVEPPSIAREVALLDEHWAWIEQQPWFSEMLDDIADLLDLLGNGGKPVQYRPCPTCGVPIRLDRIADELADHLDCLPSGSL